MKRLSLFIIIFTTFFSVVNAGNFQELGNKADKLFKDNNNKEAFYLYKKILLEYKVPPVVLKRAVASMKRAGLESEYDSLFKAAAAKYGKDPKMVIELAKSKMSVKYYGHIIAGEFIRGHHRGRGNRVYTLERDRVEALKLMFGVMPKITDSQLAADYYITLKKLLMWGRQGNNAWKLQYLTDINKLPDYQKGNTWFASYRMRYYGAPVDAAGKPVFYHVPKTFDTAANDGERWRFAVNNLTNNDKLDRKAKNNEKLELAGFFKSQFGVETVAYSMRSRFQTLNEGPYAVHLLKDDESIAKLANGVHKIKLPDDCNYISFYKELDQWTLANIYLNRRQYVKAANILKNIKGNHNASEKYKQITGNWVELLRNKTFPAGVKPKVNLKFRNAKEVFCKLTKVKIEPFISDLKASLKHDKTRREMQKYGFNPESVGRWLLEKKGERYLGEEVASWSEKLKPLPEHFDKVTQFELPVSKAGAYYLEVTAADGNTCRTLVWLSELAIIERDANGGKLYIVTDALTGKAVDFCRLKFFAYTSKYIRNPKDRNKYGDKYEFTVQKFFTQTDANGMVFVEASKLKRDSRVMVEAEVEGRLGILGFGSFYVRRYYSQKLNLQNKIYAITDRPIYRPGQTVKFNYWLRQVGYGKDDYVGKFAGRKVTLTLRSTRKTLLNKTFTLDNNGSFNSSFKLPQDADLGQYWISLDVGGGSLPFKVEEYRKPKFEVKVDMPAKSLLLGDNIPVTIKADYLFGAPVAGAKVNYKVYRTAKEELIYPLYKWDWLYGRNCCSFSSVYKYRSWRGSTPVELVVSNMGITDLKGRLSFTIDTGLAKALFNNTDNEYKVVAEVTDSSRYTEVGQGKIIAARKPFEVFCDTNKGFFRMGEIIEFRISAFTANNKKVSGKYSLDLYRISYNEKREPVETKINSWNGEKTEDVAQVSFRMDKAGYYLAKVKVTDKDGNSICKEQIIRILGKGVSRDENFCDLPLEIISDKKTYKPGEKASLMINSSKSGDVFLFVRPASANMVNYAKLVKLPPSGYIRQLHIHRSDMPNIFVEAIAVRDGRLYSFVKQILVPPEKKILNIDLKTDVRTFKPGEKCPLKVKITDANGKPVVGEVVLTVYDKALDLLSGGSNVPDIYKFFWSWKRYWYSRSRDSLSKYFYNLRKPREPYMQRLGVFGGLPASVSSFGRNAKRKSVMLEKSADMMVMPSAAVGNGGQAQKEAIVVRKNFADSIMWKVALKTDANGVAELPVPLPDNLTTWKIRAWAMTDKCSVGQGESEVIVSKDYLVRLILPRFLNKGDTATVSAIIMNRSDKTGKANTTIEISGDSLKLLNSPEQISSVAAKGEKRLDWQVQAVKSGTAAITVKSRCGDKSDALVLQLPVQIKGIVKQVATSGYMKERESAVIDIAVPTKRKPESAKLTINFSPSIAAAMVDAIPYLINTDDKDLFATINRFIPAIIAQNTLKKMNIDLKAIEKMKANLNPTELGSKRERVSQWRRFRNNPVFSEKELAKVVKKELATLCGMQNSDGGWGWFGGFHEYSYIYTTVRAVGALQLAADNGVMFDKNVLERGIAWLEDWQNRRIERIKKHNYKVNNLDALVFDILGKAGKKSDFMYQKLFAERQYLSAAGLTLFASACSRLGDKTKLEMLMRNIEQFLVEDNENQTAYLRLPDSRYWWCWYDRDIETQAEYLKLLAKTEPRGKRAAWLAKYILINRKHANYWSSVVDTGVCVEALCEFLQKSGETAPDMTVEILYDGKSLKKVKINAENMFNIDNSIVLNGKDVTSGKHKIEFKREGEGTVYFNSYLSYFSLEDYIKHTGLDLKIRRHYYKLDPVAAEDQARGSRGQALKVGVEKYKRTLIKDFSKILSGDLVEIEFTIESKNDYSYIVIQDGKAAGFEPVTKLSGYTPNSLGAYVEMRDKFVRFYVRNLARGKHSLSYRMRAVTPGKFSALPTTATGAYAPELRCNSNSFELNIK